MEISDYVPRPIDVAYVQLDAALIALTEVLAEHAHDLWAEQRLAEGWTWGDKRCDDTKTNPCIVPYGLLSEEEKAYDRRAAMGTVKAIVALGYDIAVPNKRMETAT
jgi:hypothetical protein